MSPRQKINTSPYAFSSITADTAYHILFTNVIGDTITKSEVNSIISSITTDTAEWTKINNRPVNLSYFTNDSGFITTADISGKADTPHLHLISNITDSIPYSRISGMPNIPDTSPYLLKSDSIVITMVSQLQNDSNFISSGSNISNLVNDSGFVQLSTINDSFNLKANLSNPNFIGTISADTLIINSSNLVVLNSGNVGIGTANPGNKLSVNGLSIITDGAPWTTDGFSGEAAGKHLILGYDTSASIGYISSANNGVAFTDLRYRGLTHSFWTGTGSSSQRMVIDSSGNVGIGATAPGNLLELKNSGVTSPGLRINNGTGNWQLSVGVINANDRYLSFYDVIAGLNRFVIDSSGNIGIGILSPSDSLVVAGAIAADNGEGHGFKLKKADGNYANILDIDNGNTMRLKVPGPDFFINPDTPATLNLNYNQGGQGHITMVAGSSTGNVGIGKDNPAYKLDVYGGDINLDATSGDRTFRINGKQALGMYPGWNSDILYINGYGNWTAGTLINYGLAVNARLTSDSFQVFGSAGFYSQNGSGTMVFDANGNVGIGITAPQHKLHIADGNLRLDGNRHIDFGDNYRIISFSTDSNLMSVQSGGKVAVILDNNNNGTNEYFAILKDDTRPANATEIFRVQENGNVGIGTTDPSYLLTLNGGAYCNGTTWTNASSRKYKEDINELDINEAMSAFKQLKPVSFYYKTDKTHKNLGFIAEDVPEIVATKDRNGLSAMDIVALLTKVIQEQQKLIEEQQKQFEELKLQIEALKK